jgi:hypothetical protein
MHPGNAYQYQYTQGMPMQAQAQGHVPGQFAQMSVNNAQHPAPGFYPQQPVSATNPTWMPQQPTLVPGMPQQVHTS